jgi:hypothetical protein
MSINIYYGKCIVIGMVFMSDKEKELPDDVKDSVKEANFAMYSALNAHYLILLNRQSSIIGWLIGLIGAVVGVLFLTRTPGLSESLINALISGKDSNAFVSLTVLSGAFVLAVELLISYWIYQRYLMSAVIHLIRKLELHLGNYLGLPGGTTLFDWDKLRENDNHQLKSANKFPMIVKWTLECLQPLSLYIICIIGLVSYKLSILWLIICSINKNYCAIFLSEIFFLGIFVGLIVLIVLHIILFISDNREHKKKRISTQPVGENSGT